MPFSEIIVVVLGLVLFETISSVDNAVVNADVLATMSQKARRAQGPVWIAQEFPSKQHQVGAAIAYHLVRLSRRGNDANRGGCHARLPADALGNGHAAGLPKHPYFAV